MKNRGKKTKSAAEALASGFRYKKQRKISKALCEFEYALASDPLLVKEILDKETLIEGHGHWNEIQSVLKVLRWKKLQPSERRAIKVCCALSTEQYELAMHLVCGTVVDKFEDLEVLTWIALLIGSGELDGITNYQYFIDETMSKSKCPYTINAALELKDLLKVWGDYNDKQKEELRFRDRSFLAKRLGEVYMFRLKDRLTIVQLLAVKSKQPIGV
jgi:hypothetical protein